MAMQTDQIVDIPAERVKFFGTTGKMLLPCPSTIAALIKQIPEQKVITTTQLREKLTQQFNVQGTCPVTTKKALQAITTDMEDVPYWRVINQNGGLIAGLRGGVVLQAEYLSKEGLSIQFSDKKAKSVDNFKDHLFEF